MKTTMCFLFILSASVPARGPRKTWGKTPRVRVVAKLNPEPNALRTKKAYGKVVLSRNRKIKKESF